MTMHPNYGTMLEPDSRMHPSLKRLSPFVHWYLPILRESAERNSDENNRSRSDDPR